MATEYLAGEFESNRLGTGSELANPALVTLGFALLGMPVVWLRAFLVPAAPNLAHLVFFAVCAWAIGAATTSRRER